MGIDILSITRVAPPFVLGETAETVAGTVYGTLSLSPAVRGVLTLTPVVTGELGVSVNG